MELSDLLPIPPPEQRAWRGIEVYRTISHQRGVKLADRVWHMYGMDLARAKKWFQLHEAVTQQIYEMMISHPVASKLKSNQFADTLVHNVQGHYNQITAGVEKIWQQNNQSASSESERSPE